MDTAFTCLAELAGFAAAGGPLGKGCGPGAKSAGAVGGLPAPLSSRPHISTEPLEAM